MTPISNHLPLYFVAGSQDCRRDGGDGAENLLRVLRQALASGVTCFQFRDKGAFSLENEPEKQRALAIACQDLCREFDVPFIVNDDVDLALAIEADGIHVGQTDAKVADIRARSNKPLIVGLSINTLAQAKASNEDPAIDYFGIGPIFPTQSKADPKPVVGMTFIDVLRKNGITKPLVAIGGVKADSVEQLRAFGADGVAVITAISHADDVPQAVKNLLKGAKNATE